MYSWMDDKRLIMKKTFDDIMEALMPLLNKENIEAIAEYSLDSGHNVFASFTGDPYGLETWIDIKVELRDDEGWIGDLYAYDTLDVSQNSLETAVRSIVEDYYGDTWEE